MVGKVSFFFLSQWGIESLGWVEMGQSPTTPELSILELKEEQLATLPQNAVSEWMVIVPSLAFYLSSTFL